MFCQDLDDVTMLIEETPFLENLNLAFNQLTRLMPIPSLTCLTRYGDSMFFQLYINEFIRK